jgi:hypothetical protein
MTDAGLRDGFLGNYGGEKGIKKGEGKLKVMGRTVELFERSRVETIEERFYWETLLLVKQTAFEQYEKLQENIQNTLETSLKIEILLKTMTK